ncbi:MAG TPA: FAD-dependent monooxygenase, partial [Candidatus Elarobacter sp.]|nr:FAD-dependent monooxygenase [Candidatus Elarobacter sp.]
DGDGRVTGVSVIGDDGEETTLAAPLVIGADGLRSVIGRRLDLTRVSRYPRRIAFVAHYRGIAGITEMGEMHVERDGYVGIADIGSDVTNVALVVPARAVKESDHAPDALLEAWIAGHPHLAERFAGATRLDPVRATGPFASRASRAWAPGAALVGDAADFFDPFTGEGVYTALRGGELLAPFAMRAARADTARSASEALAAYEEARRAEFGGKWMVERLIAGTVAVPALINHAARALSRRREMADLLVGVAGDFVPPREVLRAGYFARLLLFGV